MKKLILALAISAGCFGLSEAIAAPVVVTPGSMAGYTYFPPATTGSGSGGSGTDNVGTLQRCFWTPPAGDHTVNLASSNWYDYGDTRPLKLYYMVAGGNGGNNPGGGGGGSSAILKNGTVTVLGRGGDGGTISQPVEGTVQVIKTDVLRFVTGGGGGAGASVTSAFHSTYSQLSGGGGGAGYTGGGGGASSTSSITFAQYATQWGDSGGKGGGTTPGAGGFTNSASNMPGTAGSGMNGGVGVYPNGSSVANGAMPSASSPNYSINCDGTCYGQWKHQATPTFGGSHGYPIIYHQSAMIGQVPGGGGALGIGGTMGAWLTWSSFVPVGTAWTAPNEPRSFGNFNNQVVTGTRIDQFTAPTSMNLTRPGGTGFPGQIVVMYQAPVCSILR